MSLFYSDSIADINNNVTIICEQKSQDPALLQLKCKSMPREVINAIRRTIFESVPTMRIEYMYMHRNGTNVRFDDFEHGMGLVPIHTNPQLFLFPHEIQKDNQQLYQWKSNMPSDHDLTELVGYGVPHMPGQMEDGTSLDELPPPLDERIALCFELDVTCTLNEKTKTLEHSKVYGRDVIWKPLGNQQQRFQELGINIPYLKPDVVIAHLLWGQKLKWTMYAIKATGSTHPKWRGANAFFDPIHLNEYDFTIKSLDDSPPSYSLLEALKYLKNQFHQLAQDCKGRTLE